MDITSAWTTKRAVVQSLEREKIMFLVRLYPDPVLMQVSRPVKEFDENLVKFADMLVDTMIKSGGKGLAANQVGIPARIISLELDQNIMTLVNPVVIAKADITFPTDEGCLSLPSLRAGLNCRPKQVTIETYDVKGKKSTHTFFDEKSMAVMHEMDHLLGLLVLQRMSPAIRHIKRLRYLKKWKEWKKTQEGKLFYQSQEERTKSYPQLALEEL